MSVNQTRNGGTERLFLVAADPNQEPIGTLDTRGKRSTNARPRADSYPSFVQRGSIGDAGELEFSSP